MPIRDPEKKRASDARYYAANRERRRADHARYRSEHKDEIRAADARYYVTHKDEMREKEARRVAFLGKRVALKDPPRTGVCALAGVAGVVHSDQTHIHHDEYDPADPMAYTRELCDRCHGAFTESLRQREACG